MQAKRPASDGSSRRLLALVAGLLAYVLAIQLVRYEMTPTYDTARGGSRVVVLTDGSNVQMNSATELRVRFLARERDIELLKGEALFDVTHDPNRPFKVISRDSVVQAIGTQFDVRLHAEVTSIFVTSGRVAVLAKPVGNDPAEKVEVATGEEARIGDNDDGARVHVNALDAKEMRMRLAWTGGSLPMVGRPLSEIVEQFNRLNTTQIVIDDPRIAGRVLGGSFFATDPESFVTALTSFGIKSTITGTPDSPVFHLTAVEPARAPEGENSGVNERHEGKR